MSTYNLHFHGEIKKKLSQMIALVNIKQIMEVSGDSHDI